MGYERAHDLRARTKQFALSIIKLCRGIPQRYEGMVLSRQLLRSGTSVGAQYREACRARSSAEFISKVEQALQELEESAYWIELLLESNTLKADVATPLLAEIDELSRIFVASVRTARNRD
ncbi:MAG: four helix bundle protein [Tepidisphaerales bacterium]